MKFRFAVIALLIVQSYSGFCQNLTIYRSEKGVEQTSQMVIAKIKEKGLIYFETVKHEEIAKERKVDLEPTQSILFEDPDLTTKLIKCQQTTALDLPLEILVWEEHGDVYIGFIDPKFMKKRFMVSGCDETIEAMTRLMVRIANDALRDL